MTQRVELVPGTYANGAVLTLGVPGIEPLVFDKWLGRRWAWWPYGVPEGQRIGLASSRLGRKLEAQQAWFQVLRAACVKVKLQEGLFVSSAETTSARFVERAAALFGIRLLHIEVADEEADLAAWWRAMQATLTRPASENVFSLYLSPQIEDETQASLSFLVPSMGVLRDTPARDRGLVAMSDQLLVSHVRPGGHLQGLVRARLVGRDWPLGSVQVAIGKELLSEELRDELLGLGAVGWYLIGSDIGEQPADLSAEAIRPIAVCSLETNDRIISMSGLPKWSYLTHCTRHRHGAWPDESENDFLDAMLLAADHHDRSALAALLRILKQHRILATAEANRGGHQVVSFTEVPLPELYKLRTFRPHRGRWDFEPYGIGIRRSWLESHGCLPVCYGDETLWKQLTEVEQPFFQRAVSGRGRTKFDWTVEKEWRKLGNVNLAELPTDSAFVFVRTRAEAEQVARVSRWPIVVMES